MAKRRNFSAAFKAIVALKVLPSSAMRSGASSCSAQAQAMKQAEKNSGSMRFIKMLSQRSPGTPKWSGKKRRRKPRFLTRLHRNYTRGHPTRAAHQAKRSKDLVVQAVSSEPVSPEFPVKQGKTGNFRKLAFESPIDMV